VLEELGRVRDQGFAVDDEEDADGVVCVAAAARGRSGEPLLAVSVTGLAADLRGDRRVPVAEAVTATARGLERVLGGPVTGRPEVRGAGR
jgi:IclR family acetate operon transcriptional repressor